MTIKIGINGFGRIGRCVARAIMEEGYANDIQLVAINGPAATANHAHLLQYDSVHGRFRGEVSHEGDVMDMGQGPIAITHTRNPEELDWGAHGVDIVLECTGRMNDPQAAATHVARGAKKVLISAPAGNDCKTIVYGVNNADITPKDTVLSVGSCTTNCLAPVAKVLHETFGINQGFMTTVHAYTSDQNIHDGSHKDMQRARAAALSMVPTKTGAAKAIGLVLPELAGKLSGVAIRVPTPNVSLVDLTITTEKPVSVEGINQALRDAASGAMKGVLNVNEKPLVSIDYNHESASSIADLTGTAVMGEHFARVAAWYDNEWGFSCRMLDVAKAIA
jgi:glyceraldehyde 3-phosphate dehydrogenase